MSKMGEIFVLLSLLYIFFISINKMEAQEIIYLEPVDCYFSIHEEFISDKNIKTMSNIVVYSIHKKFIITQIFNKRDKMEICANIKARIKNYQIELNKDKLENFYYQYIENQDRDYHTKYYSNKIYKIIIEKIK